MAKAIEDHTGPEALRAATGRDHEGWRTLLDEAGARDWTHADTARWLVERHGIDGWWAQSITVDYEQARKGRLPGQRADGTFQTQRTRTIAGERLEALARVADAVRALHGEPAAESLAASQPNVRWRLGDGTRLQVSAGIPNRSGTPVTITHERLPDAPAAAAARETITSLLETAG